MDRSFHYFVILTLLMLFCCVFGQPVDSTNATTEIAAVKKDVDATRTVIQIRTETRPNTASQVMFRIVQILFGPLRKILLVPKVNSVMRNIATCVVNGAVELISYYFPPPLIPIIASAAGMMFPFEPIQMLKDRLPVTSYRRAFLTALNTFLGTFDKYRLDDNHEYDPYMTQRFYRRMMNYGSSETKKKYGYDLVNDGDKMLMTN